MRCEWLCLCLCFLYWDLRLYYAYGTLVDKWESIDSVFLFNLCVRVYIFDAKYMAKRVIKRVISIIGFTVCQTNKLKYSTNPLYLFFVNVRGRNRETETVRKRSEPNNAFQTHRTFNLWMISTNTYIHILSFLCIPITCCCCGCLWCFCFLFACDFHKRTNTSLI